MTLKLRHLPRSGDLSIFLFRIKTFDIPDGTSLPGDG
jgi:hypothetical protein